MSYNGAAWLFPDYDPNKKILVPYTLKFFKKINGRWYWPGAQVYRYFVGSPGGGYYNYGNEFDVLRT